MLGTSRWKSSRVKSRVNDVESESFRATTRVKSSQFALQTRVKSSQCTYRLESSPESRIAKKVLRQGFPNWLCGRGDLFFGLASDSSRDSSPESSLESLKSSPSRFVQRLESRQVIFCSDSSRVTESSLPNTSIWPKVAMFSVLKHMLYFIIFYLGCWEVCCTVD